MDNNVILFATFFATLSITFCHILPIIPPHKQGRAQIKKPLKNQRFSLAEKVGFEPTVPGGTPHFECG